MNLFKSAAEVNHGKGIKRHFSCRGEKKEQSPHSPHPANCADLWPTGRLIRGCLQLKKALLARVSRGLALCQCLVPYYIGVLAHVRSYPQPADEADVDSAPCHVLSCHVSPVRPASPGPCCRSVQPVHVLADALLSATDSTSHSGATSLSLVGSVSIRYT